MKRTIGIKYIDNHKTNNTNKLNFKYYGNYSNY